ncbi:MAG: carboxylating nicotinate-nucleotide diphosphorylase [Planctomycetaceae bacterium]|nr:carboxylating nicotinate-nucleotide diphosphorylase [Planctomycetaceae bacterium]
MVVVFDEATRSSAQRLVGMALDEDLRDVGDITSLSTIAADLSASVNIVARESGVISGGAIVPIVLEQLNAAVEVRIDVPDGDAVQPGTVIASLSGNVRSLLTAERTILNFMIHLSGVASRTAQFVREVNGTKAVILDTRKTFPGYRLLHKYAVRCGGGHNHRMGLFDGILIKDNHLAARGDRNVGSAVAAARTFLASRGDSIPIEIEVDTLDQLRFALAEHPEIVLLDNMSIQQLEESIRLRDQLSASTLLEASGGISLETVGAIARTGVDRISIGGLTHSATALDLGFDWPW